MLTPMASPFRDDTDAASKAFGELMQSYARGRASANMACERGGHSLDQHRPDQARWTRAATDHDLEAGVRARW